MIQTKQINLVLPESIADITLEQYQKYQVLRKRDDISDDEITKRFISIFTGLKYRDAGKISQSDYSNITNEVLSAMATPADFTPRFKLNGIAYGFIPNLDKMTTMEYVDLKTVGVSMENMHRVMGILFRPITETDSFGNYRIESYDGLTPEQEELMKQCPLHIVNGAMVFFWTLAKELRVHIQKFTEEVEAQKRTQQTTSQSGDGTQQ